MASKIPDWMSELYIAVLVFGVPVNKLMFYRRSHNGNPWTVGILCNTEDSNIQEFIDLLQERDEKDIDF